MSSYFKLGSLFKGISTTATAGGTTTLTSSSKQLQQFTGTSTQTVVLPSGTTLALARRFDIYNRSTGAVTVQANGGGALGTVAAGSQEYFLLTDNSSSAGVWAVGGVTGGGGATVSTGDKLNLLSGMAGINASTDNIESRLLNYSAEEQGGDFWTTKASVTIQKTWAATFNLNGYIYNTGGITSGTDVATTERFYDDNNYWLGRAAQTTARDSSASHIVSGKAYVFGGLTAGSATVSAVHEEYTDSTNTWATKTAYPTALYGPACFSINGIGYGAGGLVVPGTVYQTVVNAYDPTANAWYSRAALSTASGRNAGSDANYKDNGYVFGGSNTSGRVEKYSTALNAWLTVKTMANIQAYAALMIMGGSVTVAGGESSTGTNTNVVENYQDTLDTWVTKAPAGNSVDTNGCSLNGTGYKVAGGTGSSSHVALVESYINFNFCNLGSLKRTLVAPTSILVSVLANNLSNNLPIQIRSNGDEWKYMTSGLDSSLKTGETLLAKFVENGLVYSAGGDTNAAIVSTNEFYNPVSDTWIARQAMATAYTAAAGFRYGGIGYIAGGYNTFGGSTVATITSYNDITNAWTGKSGTLSAARGSVRGATLNGFGYAVGGGSSSTASGVVDKYNPNTDTASAVTSLGTARWGTATVRLLGRLFAIGGASGNGSTANGIANNDRYDDVLNTWTAMTAIPFAKSYMGCFTLSGIGYWMQGDNTSSADTTGNFSYNPVTDAWNSATIASAPYASENGNHCSSGGFGYIAGGSNGGGGVRTTAAKFNDAANTFVTTSSLNTAKQNSAGGEFTPGAYHNYEVRVGIPANYVGTGNDTWIAKANMNIARDNLCGGRISDDVSVASGGGSIGTGLVSTEYYTEPLNTWIKSTDAPGGIDGAAPFILQGLLYACSGDSAITTARSYNHILRSWASIANVNTGRSRMYSNAGHSLNGIGYMVGGYSSGAANLASIEGYNPNTNTWTTKSGSLSGIATGNTANAVASGFMYRVGGFDNSGNTTTAATQLYNDVADTFTTKTSYPNNIFGAISHEKSLDSFLIMGGSPSSGTYNTASYEYRATMDAFLTRTSIPVGTNGACFDGKFLFAGGNGSALATSYAYAQGIKNAILGIALEIK